MKSSLLSYPIVVVLLFILWFVFVFVGDVNFEGWSILIPVSILTFLLFSVLMSEDVKKYNGNSINFSNILIVASLFFTVVPSLKAPFASDLFYYSSFVGLFVSILFILFVHNNFF